MGREWWVVGGESWVRGSDGDSFLKLNVLISLITP